MTQQAHVPLLHKRINLYTLISLQTMAEHRRRAEANRIYNLVKAL